MELTLELIMCFPAPTLLNFNFFPSAALALWLCCQCQTWYNDVCGTISVMSTDLQVSRDKWGGRGHNRKHTPNSGHGQRSEECNAVQNLPEIKYSKFQKFSSYLAQNYLQLHQENSMSALFMKQFSFPLRILRKRQPSTLDGKTHNSLMFRQFLCTLYSTLQCEGLHWSLCTFRGSFVTYVMWQRLNLKIDTYSAGDELLCRAHDVFVSIITRTIGTNFHAFTSQFCSTTFNIIL